MPPKATDPPADPPEGTDPPEGDGAEKHFWTKLEQTLDARIDAGIDRAIEKRTKSGGRTDRQSFPEALAKFLGI